MSKWFATVMTGAVLSTAGCTVPLAGMHGTMHPSVDGDSSGAGVAVGAFDAQTDDGPASSNAFVIPYGEGWARFTAGPGQFELRIGLPFTSAAYRWNIVDGTEGPGFSLVPGLGLAYARTETTFPDGMGRLQTEVEGVIVFAPELGMLITFVENQLYLAPRIGLVHSAVVAGADPMDDDTTEDILSIGGAIGWNFAGTAPFWYSLELSFVVADDMDDGADDGGTTWYFIPTFGIHTG